VGRTVLEIRLWCVWVVEVVSWAVSGCHVVVVGVGSVGIYMCLGVVCVRSFFCCLFHLPTYLSSDVSLFLFLLLRLLVPFSALDPWP
jgi:hypothetical protein